MSQHAQTAQAFGFAHPSPPLPSQHLLTCELDGRELKTLDNCMSKLKRLDGKGRLWPQQMIMEVHRGYLVLSDIETKVRLHIPQIRGHYRARTRRKELCHTSNNEQRLQDTV